MVDLCKNDPLREHKLIPKDGNSLELYNHPILGWGVDVACTSCRKTGFVRLDFDNVSWDD